MRYLFLFFLLSSFVKVYALGVGDRIKDIELKNPDGDVVALSHFYGKVLVIFYVDPDVSGTNERFSEALRKKRFPITKYQSIAIVNLEDTWKPNFIIRQILKIKQRRYERAKFLVDEAHKFAKRFALSPTDNQFITIIFDKNGICRFIHYGEIANVNEVISLIERLIKE